MLHYHINRAGQIAADIAQSEGLTGTESIDASKAFQRPGGWEDALLVLRPSK